MRVTIGGHHIEFEPKPQAEESTYKRYGRQELRLNLPYKNIRSIGVVIFQLLDESDQPVAYYMHHIKNFTSETIEARDPENPMAGPTYEWATLLPDNAVKKIHEPHKAGMFSFRGQIHGPISDDNPETNFKEYAVWKARPAMRL